MTLSEIMDIASSGLEAQRVRMTVTASNLANAESTRTQAGGPYRRRAPIFTAKPLNGSFASTLNKKILGVRVTEIVEDQREPIERYQPGHPDANASGIVAFPRVNPMEELINMMSASRSFEASLLIMRKVREMGEAALQLGR